MNLSIAFARTALNLWVVALLGCVALPALAQWQWTDNNGKKVFSDAPPPQDVPERNIIKRPAGAAFSSSAKPVTTAASAVTVPGASVPKTAASAPKPTGKDLELEKKKAQADAEDAAKKKAEEQKQAAARADSCDRAKRNLASLQSGARIAQLNAQGEREFMSEESRQAEVQRTQGIVNADCR